MGLGVVSATLFALYIIACVQVVINTELKSFRNPIQNRRVCTPEKKYHVEAKHVDLSNKKGIMNVVLLIFFGVMSHFHIPCLESFLGKQPILIQAFGPSIFDLSTNKRVDEVP